MIDLNNVGKKQVVFLEKAYQKKQLAHSYLFVDNDEIRALNTAYWLACLYNCTGENKPDGTCRNCRRILTENYPDVLMVEPEGKKTLGIDQIRPLKMELAKSPVESSRRFFFINEAQNLTLPAANALLNLLEEPIAPVVSILITNNVDQILPTIRSRTQVVTFNKQSAEGKTADLLNDGFSQAEIDEIGDSSKIDQLIKYFYQEMLEYNNLAFISAHNLAELAKTPSVQKYILFNLKHLAEQALNNNQQRQTNAMMLKYLMQVDKMRFSNVNFRNLLDYLTLQWKR